MIISLSKPAPPEKKGAEKASEKKPAKAPAKGDGKKASKPTKPVPATQPKIDKSAVPDAKVFRKLEPFFSHPVNTQTLRTYKMSAKQGSISFRSGAVDTVITEDQLRKAGLSLATLELWLASKVYSDAAVQPTPKPTAKITPPATPDAKTPDAKPKAPEKKDAPKKSQSAVLIPQWLEPAYSKTWETYMSKPNAEMRCAYALYRNGIKPTKYRKVFEGLALDYFNSKMRLIAADAAKRHLLSYGKIAKSHIYGQVKDGAYRVSITLALKPTRSMDDWLSMLFRNVPSQLKPRGKVSQLAGQMAMASRPNEYYALTDFPVRVEMCQFAGHLVVRYQFIWEKDAMPMSYGDTLALVQKFGKVWVKNGLR